SPRMVETDRDRSEELANARGELRVTGRGILHIEQRLRKTVEIMDRLRPRHRRDRRAADEPVRGDCQDRLRLAGERAELPPGLGVAVVLERIHRAAVADENRGKTGCRLGHEDRWR